MSFYGEVDEQLGYPAVAPISHEAPRDLCQGLKALAAATWQQLGLGAGVACQPSETTLTDSLLISLATQFRDRVIVRRTSQRRERRIGSDFEVRFLDEAQYVQLRLQAKRLDVPTQWYLEFNKTAAAVKQAKTLLAASSRWPAP
jgi:hypothetical protein